MPTQTFFNLTKDKRDRVMDAAVREFAQYAFSNASINRIVKSAEISRGSFYQYFSDKEDVYIHILKLISEEKMRVFSVHMPEASDAGFFELIMSTIPAIFEWADQNPLYNRIGLLLAQEDAGVIERLALQTLDSRAWLIGLLERDQKAGKIRAEIDAGLILDMHMSISSFLLKEYYLTGTKQSTLEKLAVFYDILQNGLKPSEG